MNETKTLNNADTSERSDLSRLMRLQGCTQKSVVLKAN